MTIDQVLRDLLRCSSPIFLPILLLASYLFFGSYRMMCTVYRGQQLEMKAHKSMVTDRTTERGIYHQHTHTLMCIHTERVCVYIVMASEAFFSLFSLCMRCLSLLLVNRCIEARGVKIDPRLAPFTRNRLIRVFSIYYRPHLYFAASNFKPSTRLLVIKAFPIRANHPNQDKLSPIIIHLSNV